MMQIKREGFRAKPAKVAQEGVSFRNLFAFWYADDRTQSPSSATQSCPAGIRQLHPIIEAGIPLLMHKPFTADISDFTNAPTRFTSSGALIGTQIGTKSSFQRQCRDELNRQPGASKFVVDKISRFAQSLINSAGKLKQERTQQVKQATKRETAKTQRGIK